MDHVNVMAKFEVRSFTRWGDLPKLWQSFERRGFTHSWVNSDWSFGWGLRTPNLGEEEAVGAGIFLGRGTLHFGCTRSPKMRLVAANSLSIWDSWVGRGYRPQCPPGYAYAQGVRDATVRKSVSKFLWALHSNFSPVFRYAFQGCYWCFCAPVRPPLFPTYPTSSLPQINYPMFHWMAFGLRRVKDWRW